MDLTQAGSGQIFAIATLRFVPKVSAITELPLDLLDLTVDSVTSTGNGYSYSQSGETLTIDLGGSYAPPDTLELAVHYHGDPAIDGSGWGGFYTSGNVLYDLGVAFESQPHSYGRSWFPCFDNFVERCSFEFIVRTNNDRRTWCNGMRLSETDLGGGQWESHWLNEESMPSYLASVTASTYAEARDTLSSITGAQIPVTLVAQAGDTTAMKNSFVHLPDAFDCFEDRFGPYRWDRVGYCATPQGAMEHSCNISYPTSIITGTIQYEATMAHELAHHWFGNLVTCERAEEMYINEGFAEYLSYLFLLWVHGEERYMNTVRDNHYNMLLRSHVIDEGWWPLADMPQDWTYGTTTYNKGADVLHTLRNYLGDALFNAGLESFLADNAFLPVNSQQLRDQLGTTTGTQLDDFFDDWIFQSGWAAFEVDSFTVTGAAPSFNVAVHIQQKTRGPANLYHEVPVTLNAVDGSGSIHLDTVMVGGAFTTVNLSVPFAPTRIGLNEDERISLAITQDRDTITTTGSPTLAHTNLQLVVNSIPAPLPLLVQEYWVAADDHVSEAFAYQISPDRWWRVIGELPPGTDIAGRITFDARPTSTTPTDPGLTQTTGSTVYHEDSMALFHRADATQPWTEVPGITINTFGTDATNGYGRIEWAGFTTGDYTIGWRKSATTLTERPIVQRGSWQARPNPASDRITIEWTGNGPAPSGTFILIDSTGREVLNMDPGGQRQVTLELPATLAGELIIRFVEALPRVHDLPELVDRVVVVH